MDPVSAAASIVTLIEVTGHTIALIRKLTATHKNARKEQAMAARRLFDLSSLLGQIAAFRQSTSVNVGDDPPAYEDINTERILAEIGAENGTLAHCKDEVLGLRSTLEEMVQQKRLVWIFKAEKVQKRLQSIKIDIDTLHQLFQNDMLSSILKATSRIDEVADAVNALSIRSDTRDVFKWLDAAGSTTNYGRARQRYQPGTGDWFLEMKVFHEWKSTPQLMWLYGISGCGKTILSSTIIEHLKTEYNNHPDIAVVYFFFDFQDSRKQSPDRLLRSLLEQLAAESEDAVWSVRQLYDNCAKGRAQPSREQMHNACSDAMGSFEQVFIIVDGLDECNALEYSELGVALEDLMAKSDNVHLIALSQPIQAIQNFMKRISQQTMAIKGMEVSRDIEIYVRQRIQDSVAMSFRSSEQLHDIAERLCKASGGMFRWVQLQLDELERCENDREVESQLESLPSGLPETYQRILTKLNDKQKGKAIHILTCLAMANSSLRKSAIENSLQIEPDADVRIAPSLKPNPGVVANMLPGLVLFTPKLDVEEGGSNAHGNDPDGELRLAHSSVKDYLLSPTTRTGKMADFAIDPPLGHLYMAKLCVACLLNFGKDMIARQVLQETPFLPYAGNNLSIHATAANQASERGTLDTLIVKLLDENQPAFKNWYRVCNPFTTRDYWDGNGKPTYSPLQHAVAWNLWRVAGMLIDAGANKDQKIFDGGFRAIHSTVEFGSLECIDMLVERGADVNGTAWPYKTALHYASQVPHDNGEVVARLISHGANMNALDPWIGTPLQQAAHEGRPRITQTLLEKGANPNIVFKHDRISSLDFGTALQCAAYWGHLKVVEALLNKRALINHPYGKIGTPLHAAAINGKSQAVDLLLTRGAKISEEAGMCGSVLEAAYYGGDMDTIRLVLTRLGAEESEAAIEEKIVEASEKCPDLYEAARRNAVGKIYQLLDNGAKINDRVFLSGDSAILLAAKQGHFAAVEALIKRGADLQSRDRGGTRAIHAAARRGDLEMVRLLLEQGAEEDIKDDGDRSALDVAEGQGHSQVVELLNRLHKAGKDLTPGSPARPLDSFTSIHLLLAGNMSFNYGTNDIILALNLCKYVYTTLKDAPAEYRECQSELKSVAIAIGSLKEHAEDPSSIVNRKGASRIEDLANIVENCQNPVRQLQTLVSNHSSIVDSGNGQMMRVWHKFKFGLADLESIRDKLNFHLLTINAFLTSLQAFRMKSMERKLDKIYAQLITDAAAGARDMQHSLASIASTRSSLILFDVERQGDDAWLGLKEALIAEDISMLQIDAHRSEIFQYVKSLLTNDASLEAAVALHQLPPPPPPPQHSLSFPGFDSETLVDHDVDMADVYGHFNGLGIFGTNLVAGTTTDAMMTPPPSLSEQPTPSLSSTPGTTPDLGTPRSSFSKTSSRTSRSSSIYLNPFSSAFSKAAKTPSSERRKSSSIFSTAAAAAAKSPRPEPKATDSSDGGKAKKVKPPRHLSSVYGNPFGGAF
ncbi:uncharacterized protein KY384_007485 [Bacidia gigantensis]|uniref:uncharacterized protein n=1 Tax=Bacidia gigantensis TaxID=2732470 RepID=UPI001D039253|nr:uncharacterized protein KY384_007485 [Bacidia gigantensis]KAG8527333.1 hypothetical protein KY384_007485 [Bacidia gigantensis]